MKKILLFIFAALLPFAAFADGVSPERAVAVAGAVLKVDSSNLRMVAQERIQTRSLNAEPAWYVFDKEDGGFVIVSGEDSVSPVLGYSEEGSFDKFFHPSNFVAWMDMWSTIIEDNRRNGIMADSSVKSEWASFESCNRGPVTEHESQTIETALWGQSAPFNYYCPSFDSRTCVTGCVATAVSIIMRHHRWPSVGHGVLPDYSYVDDDGQRREIKGFELSTEYDWENMPLKFDDETTTEQQMSVARLISDVGVMLNSSYNPDGTGAYTSSVPPAMEQFMSYDPSMEIRYREYYPGEKWERMIFDEIDNGRPVLYSGYSQDEGGHAFVIDGYNDAGKFRINWGWKGRDNGYYVFPKFGTFTLGQDMICGMKPDEGGKNPCFLAVQGSGTRSPGIYTDTEDYQTGVPFKAYCENVFNMGTRTVDAYVSLVKVNKNYEIQEVFDIDTVTFEPMYGGGFFYDPVVIETPIEIGDKLVMAYYTDDDQDWKIMEYDRENGTVGEIPIADTKTIQEETTVKYTSEKAMLVVSTKADAVFSLVDSSGKEVRAGLSQETGVLTIDCNKLPLDTYVLTAVKAKESMSIELKMGKL